MSEECKAVTHYTGEWNRDRPCLRNANKDGYCFQHHPDAVKARKAKRKAAFEAPIQQAHREVWEQMRGFCFRAALTTEYSDVTCRHSGNDTEDCTFEACPLLTNKKGE